MVQLVKDRMENDAMQMAYPDLLAWLFVQQKDYVSAFAQIKWMDEKLQEQGRRMLGFARNALREKEFKAAEIAYSEVIQKGVDAPFYQLSRAELLTCKKEKLYHTKIFLCLSKSNDNFTR